MGVVLEGESDIKKADYSQFTIGTATEGYQFNVGRQPGKRMIRSLCKGSEDYTSIGSHLFITTNGKSFTAHGDSTCSGSNKYRGGWWYKEQFCGDISLNAPFTTCSTAAFCAKVANDQYVSKTKMMIKIG